MKHRTQSIFYLLLLVSWLGTGCSSKRVSPDINGEVRVLLQVSQDGAEAPGTKTWIGGDRLDRVYWSERDTISLYWRTSGSTEALGGEQRFHCYQYEPSASIFAAQMEAMGSGSYDYYAAFPRPASVDGTKATYRLPAEQEGTYAAQGGGRTAPYTGNLDVMVAEPLTGQPGLVSDQMLTMNFVHQCHVMRIQVPTGRNQWGANIRKLRVEFPSAVVGNMTVNLADPQAAPTLADGGNVVTAVLPQAFGESEEDSPEGNYVWLFLCPGTITGEVRFTAYDENGYQSQSLSVSIDKTLEKGRVTPINLTIPNELPVTWIDFSIVGNNLGEEPRSFTVTAPEGATFRNGTNTQTFTVNDQNLYSLGFYNEYDGIDNGSAMRSGPMTITYDSEHALVSDKQTLTAFTVEGHTPISLTVPYLLYEDFGAVGDVESGLRGDPEELSGYNLPEWSGSRFGLKANTSAMIFAYLGSSVVTDPDGGDNHRGRLDTPMLTGLKEGQSVSLRVLYNVSGTKQNGNTIFGKTTVMYSKYEFGIDTKTGTVNGDDNAIEQVVHEEEPGTDGSYTNIPYLRDFVITGCTNRHRLSWRTSFRVNGQGISTITAGYTYVYIDNIRVSIVP